MGVDCVPLLVLSNLVDPSLPEEVSICGRLEELAIKVAVVKPG